MSAAAASDAYDPGVQWATVLRDIQDDTELHAHVEVQILVDDMNIMLGIDDGVHHYHHPRLGPDVRLALAVLIGDVAGVQLALQDGARGDSWPVHPTYHMPFVMSPAVATALMDQAYPGALSQRACIAVMMRRRWFRTCAALMGDGALGGYVLQPHASIARDVATVTAKRPRMCTQAVVRYFVMRTYAAHAGVVMHDNELSPLVQDIGEDLHRGGRQCNASTCSFRYVVATRTKSAAARAAPRRN